MESEPHPRSPRQGIAMMVVLGVVVFFTMLGFMGLEMATKDSQVSGTLLDIKSKESAAWGGLNLALGVMQSTPSTTVAELQKFIADSSVAPSNKRQWLSFNGGTFSLVASDPGFFNLGTGGDRTGVKVRVVSMDINGTTGINDGSGVPITLECTGQGRNGQQLKIIASYRMLGLDVPVVAASGGASGGPSFAFYLNGGVANGNMGTQVQGSVFMNAASSFNSVTQRVVGRLIVNGGLYLNDSLTVDSGAVIHGTLSVQMKGARFRGNLILNDFSTNMGHWVVVDSSLVFRGSGSGSGYYFNTAFIGLKVARDFVAIQADPFAISGGANLIVGRNAWMRGFKQQNGVNFSVGGNLEVVGNPVNGFTIPDGPGVLGGAGYIGGYVAARGLTSSNLRFVQNNGASHTVAGAIYSSTGLEVSSMNFSSGGIEAAGTGSGLRGLASSSGTSFTVNGDMWVAGQGSVSLKPTIKGNLYMNAPVPIGATGWTLAGGTASAKRNFTFNNTGNPNPTVLGGPNVNSVANPADAAMPTDASFVGAYQPPPNLVTDLHFAPSDTAATLAANPPDTMYVDATHSPVVNTNVVTMTNTLCDQATAAGFPVHYDNWTGTDFNNLYAYLSSKGKLVNGYMVVALTSASTFSSINNPAPAFSGKALWIIEKAFTVGGNWPSSANPSAIQVIYVRGSGSLGNWGFRGNFYGYIHFENTLTGNGTFGFSGTTLYGAIAVRGANSTWTPNSSNLTIVAMPAVFTDITTNLPGVFHPAGSSGSGSGTPTGSKSSKTLAVRAPTAGIQFVRIGEFR